MLKYFVLGFLVKLTTGFDDTLTHIPVMASVTRSKWGRWAFACGIVLAISLAIVVALFFARLIHELPYARFVAAGLLLVLAAAIYFDWLVHEKRKKVEVEFKRKKRISNVRVARMVGVGFVAAFATVIDDTVAYAALFAMDGFGNLVAIMGIFAALAVELYVVLKFAKPIMKFKYKDELAAGGLIVLASLIVSGLI